MNSNKGRSNYRTKMASLKINGKHYSLCEGINTIGRCITATVPLKHMDISKQHAIITIVNENQHYVTDFQSFNGTVMNDSKLQPLVLYELSEGCSIQFGNVNAVYHKIPTVSQAQQHGHDYSASSIESTQNSQFITQTFYDGATQALDNDTSVSHEPHEIEHPQNYFDDDYNFADVSTQLSPPTLPTNPSKPLSIHDMPTQLFCEDVQESVVVTSDDKNIDQQPIVGKGTTELCEDIHEMETQIDDNLSIHNMPTQLISSNKDIHDMVTQPLDGSSINNMPTQLNTKHQDVDKGIHQTVTEPLNSSSIHNVTSDSNNQDSKDIHETVTQPIDRSSIYNMPTQLTKNTNNVSLNSTSVIDETINLSDIHEEAIKTQSSDSELQVNQLRRRTIRSIGDDSETSDKESESEEVVKCKMRKKAKILESESETDAEEDMLNVKLDLATYKRETKMDSGSETDIEDLVMETKTDDKVSCPVPDEPVKLSTVENDVASIGSDTDIDDFEINTQADTSNLNEDEDDYIIPATQCDNTDLVFQDDNKTSEEKEDVNKMADSVEMDSLYLEPTQPILNDDVFLEPPVPVTAVSEKKPVTKDPYNISITDDEIFIRPTQPVVQCIEYDPIFEQATQPITFEQQTKSKKNLNSEQVTDLQSDAIFMQPTQPIVDISMEDVKPVDSSLDDIFIQPTQPIQIPSKDMLPPTFTGINKISGTEKQKVDSPVDAIFMAPTQVIHTQEDIFEQSTQIVSDQKLRADNIEERLEDMFASQRPPEKLPQIESQLEVIFDSQNFGIDINNSRPSNPLVTELEGRLKDKETIATTTIESSIIDKGKSSRRKTPPSSVQIVATDKVKNYSVELLDRISMSLHENKEKSGYDSISVEAKGAIEEHEADRRNNESSVDELISISSSKPNRKRAVTQKPSMKTEMVKNKVEDEPKLEMTEKTKETRRRNNETAVDECISISTSKPNRKRTVTKKLSEETEVVKNKVEDKQKLEMTEKTEETRRRNNETAVDECISISTSRPNRKRAVTKKLSEETEVVKNKVEDEQKLEMTEKRKETRRRNNETAVDESVSISTSKPNRKGAVTKKLSEETEIRNKRALKPKVVFTMLDNPDLESVIRRLGGRIVDSVEGCTVLVTGNLKRSQKLLTAVGQSKPICSPDWILECKKANKFLDPWDYILQDKEAEDKWKLSLKESLNRSRDHRLLEGYVVYLTVTSAIDVLKGAIESCGGKCVLKAPPKSTGNLIVVANAENKAKYSKFLKQSPPVNVVLPEAIFDGVLRQELRLGDHLLK
ncbi:hypothetical protein RI129_002159 [Pyrocoelia pectoralis]|uniref:Mediator of DNA damage checkpoint protein 1 n=1 Tax=Pyrocoelia pectoralis TaxID=417401 RepID=A0AAN7ZKT3_9COLE